MLEVETQERKLQLAYLAYNPTADEACLLLADWLSEEDYSTYEPLIIHLQRPSAELEVDIEQQFGLGFDEQCEIWFLFLLKMGVLPSDSAPNNYENRQLSTIIQTIQNNRG